MSLFKIPVVRSICIACLVGSGVILSLYKISNFSHNVSDLITALLLYLTFVILIWYSWETRQLKIETRRMRKLAAEDNTLSRKQGITDIRPYLRLQRIPSHRYLQLVNEGKGVAVNLEPIFIKGRQKIPLLRIPAMAAAPNSYTVSFVPDNFMGGFSSGFDKLDAEREDFMIRIKYEDIEGRRYEAIFQSERDFNDKFSIVSQEEFKK